MYQLLAESAEFFRRYEKNILAYFFLGHSVYYSNNNNNDNNNNDNEKSSAIMTYS